MTRVLEWVKLNVLIVVFIALMIAALIALPLLAGGMNEKVRDRVEQRARAANDLAQLERTELAPGQTGIVNERFIDRYSRMATSISEDARAVQDAAIKHNRKDRGVLLASVFPEPPPAQAEVLPKHFHEALEAAYRQLLADIKAGSPPGLESLRDELERTRQQFLNQDLKKDLNDKLDPTEEKQLRDKLSKGRMGLYAEAAAELTLYAGLEALRVPAWEPARLPTSGELYLWQWQYWIVDDVLRALHQANAKHRTVVNAPVKHVLNLSVVGLPAPAGESMSGTVGGTSSFSMPGGGGGRGGFGETGGGQPAEDTAGASGAPADPKLPVPSDFNVSLTGRKTNPLYDVVYVDLEMIVDAERLPEVLDALGQYNFMTVIALSIGPVDAYEAARSGYFYGSAPLAHVSLRLETIWLRAWTSQFMPKSIKRALGVADQAAPPSA